LQGEGGHAGVDDGEFMACPLTLAYGLGFAVGAFTAAYQGVRAIE
jgi:hypothetical protein